MEKDQQWYLASGLPYPETTPNCDAMISKAKATAREPIRTLVIHAGESQYWR